MRILLFQYPRFSLRRLREIMTFQNMEPQLTEQKKLLLGRKQQLAVISAIEITENSRESGLSLSFLVHSAQKYRKVSI